MIPKATIQSVTLFCQIVICEAMYILVALYHNTSMNYDDDRLKNLGKNIAKYRKQKKLSQNALSDILDISREHLAKIETAKRGISIHLLFELCDALQITPEKLFESV